MKFSAILTILPLALAAAVPAEVATRASAVDNTNKIITGLHTLESAVTALDKLVLVSPPNIVNVQNQEQTVEKDITAITNNVKASSVVTAAESTKVYNEIKNVLEPKITKTLNDLVAKKPAFSSVASAVKIDLQNLNKLAGALGNAFIAKAQGTAKTNGPALVKEIQAKFAKAIAAYS